MKKSFIAMGIVAIAALCFSSCAKESVPQDVTVSGGVPFEISASSVSSKTTNDGLNTKWANKDALTVFHAEAGTTTYSSNDKFTVTAAGETSFSGTLTQELDNAKSYDWYAIYPYSSYYTTPANTTCYQQIANNLTQKEYGSTAHLAGSQFPLVGKAKAVAAGTTPNIVMKQVCAVIKVVVTNNSGSGIVISTASITSANVNLAGGYFINFAGDEPVLIDENYEDHSKDSYMYKTVSLTVTGGTAIADGGTATLYFGVKPFTAQNETLKLSVNGYEKECVIGAEAVEFKAGHIKTVNFNYDKAPVKLTVGNYAIMAKKSSGNYWYMTSTETTTTPKHLQAIDSNLSELPDAVSVSADKVWTVSESAGGYKISTQEGKQISWTDGNAAELKDAEEGKELSVISLLNGAYWVLFTTETETKTLELNNNSDFFAFYSTLSQYTDLYFVPATINTTSTLTLKETSISDVAAAGVTGATETGVYTLENAVDGDVNVSFDCTVVTAASISGGALTYTVAANTGAARDGWVKLKLGEQDAQTITISQKAYSNSVTYQHVFTSKPSAASGDIANGTTALSGYTWNIVSQKLGAFQKTYAGVQVGTSSELGYITLTSPSSWSYTQSEKTVTKIKEVRVWLNAGDDNKATASVTIDGNAATPDVTSVSKKSNLEGDWTKAPRITFTPASGHDTGVVVINVANVSGKAAYICAIEIEAEEE